MPGFFIIGMQVLLEGLDADASYEYCLYAGNGTDRLTGQSGSFKTLCMVSLCCRTCRRTRRSLTVSPSG